MTENGTPDVLGPMAREFADWFHRLGSCSLDLDTLSALATEVDATAPVNGAVGITASIMGAAAARGDYLAGEAEHLARRIVQLQTERDEARERAAGLEGQLAWLSEHRFDTSEDA